MQLYYLPGSPFARITRIVALEAGVACDFVVEKEFPPRLVLDMNPAMQVPTLRDGERIVFGTPLITDYLLAEANIPAVEGMPPFAGASVRAEARWRDAQILSALQALLAAIVTRSYLILTKAEHQPGADIDLDLTAHEMNRIHRLLDWLDDEANEAGFIPGRFSLQDIWLIAAIGFTEARIPIEWHGRPRLEAIVEAGQSRPSVEATAPPPWTPWD